jgi:RNA polymerase-binding transcription factor DksA
MSKDNRYTQEELDKFREFVDKKLARAREDFEYMQKQINEMGMNSDGDHSSDYIDGSAAHMDIQRMNEMAKRHLMTIEELEEAKVRIRQGTYGICSVSGEKIDPKRLRLVPGAKRSVEGQRLFNLGKAKDRDLTAM